MKKMIMTAIAKGIIHATLVPAGIFTLVNKHFDGNYGGVAALVYMMAVYVLYNFVLERKDISRKAYNYTFILIVVVPVILKVLQALSYGIAG